MRIGILTQALTTNYGGILQNYALQTVLRDTGSEVWTLDIGKSSWREWGMHTLKTFIKKILGRQAKFMVSPIKKERQERPLRKFVRNNINLTTPRTKLPARDIVSRYSFDCIIVGSDQVWRPCYNYGFINELFLSFTKGMDIKRIAYAASFGTDQWEYTKEEETECALLAKDFNAISVREDSGVELCRNHFGIEATHVLDPTLLLESSHYANLCVHIPTKESFVFAYILDQSLHKLDDIKRFAESKALPYFIMSAGPEVGDSDTIEQWLSFFRDAKYVITDSFHGTAFSIIFNKDFYVYGNSHRGNSRFHSLLNGFNLCDRIIEKDFKELPLIDWNYVNEERNKKKEFSLQWLKKSISL